MSRKPFAVHKLIDCGRDVALVRYDGDPDVFTALAYQWLTDYGLGDRVIEPPQPRLYRMDPCNSDDYAWTLAEANRPGRGVFTGALITLARRGQVSDIMAPYGCWRCEARPGEYHLTDCQRLSLTASEGGR